MTDTTVTMADILTSLIRLSEKAAHLARTIRSEHALFELLVEEKTGTAKNKRFQQDFKTLADVLIQEMVKHNLGKQFPSIIGHIHGEEDNTFTNQLGETITVEVQPSLQQTSDLLCTVLDGNQHAAMLLAEAVHWEVTMETDQRLTAAANDIPVESLGIWIDPIDSTAEYIRGAEDETATDGVFHRGLQCCTVLIGAFDRQSGLPVMGVVNQPFAYKDQETLRWRSRHLWGVCYNGYHCHSLMDADSTVTMTTEQPNQSEADRVAVTTEQSHQSESGRVPSVVLSESESDDIKSLLSKAGYRLCYANGAGYKMLCVIDNLVDAYVLTKSSTYKWDTCGPHAILRALGGGMVDLEATVKLFKPETGEVDLKQLQIKYNQPDSGTTTWGNMGGLLAYRSPGHALNVPKALCSLH
ncbi:PREDICTED: inositol polyphosphate 1-phosphatase-like [Branchiostoma belcheri]|uniref:inositol-1,4-bisphosphate 1-phosphatase n=1 Tax=Branchiostoma belcheri TaxID=7741 RepID=A0A6P4YS80_BRABE|nr:PREDICTED: inositol polyphosphate 1-phosphatase-like [Branchiostoma belcheri]